MDTPAVVVLAGGEGTRIGGGKPLRRLGSERLIDRALRQARNWSDVVAVSVRNSSQFGDIDARILLDDPAVEGPLAGLIAALAFARSKDRNTVLTIASDMPFLPDDLPQRLALAIGHYACALASSGGRLHPVCGLWRTSALAQVDRQLETGQRSLKSFAERVGSVAVEWPGGSKDPFFNINTAEDLAGAERRIAR